MKSWIVMAAVGAVGTPFVVHAGVDSLDPGSLDSEGGIFAKAQEIARREFSADASLTILEVKVSDVRLGTFGERVKADPGYVFHHVKVRLENTGKVDLSAATHQFSALDEIGSDHSVELDSNHHDFDGSRLGKGQARVGNVVFEMMKGSTITGIVWQGDLARAEGGFASG